MGNLKFKKQRTCPKPRLERGIYRADLQNAIILDSNDYSYFVNVGVKVRWEAVRSKSVAFH